MRRYGYTDVVARHRIDAFIEQLEPQSVTRSPLIWFTGLLKTCWRYFLHYYHRIVRVMDRR